MSNLRTVDSVSTQQVTRDGVDEAVYQVVIHIPVADAERLAAHKRARVAAGADVLASEAREVADPVLEALVAAGYGA